MKLRTKLIIAFMTIVILPVLLGIITVSLLNHIQLREIRDTYGISNTSDLFASDYIQMFHTLTESMQEEVAEALGGNVSLLEDDSYLEQWNESLQEKKTFLIVRKGETIVYCGSNEVSENLLLRLPDFAGKTESLDLEGYYLGGEFRYLISQQDFVFSDGTEGSLFLVTSVSLLLHNLVGILKEMLVLVVLILVITAIILVFWLYGSIIRPIGMLRKAAQEIRDGNLDFPLEVQGKDEIGGLCMDFEEMRRRLKQTAEEQIQRESENRVLISNISHDLKTPITAIKGYVEGILDGVAASPERIDKYIRTIYHKANDMDRLIDELALYSKIDTNRIPYNFAPLSVEAYFRDCVEEMRLELEAKNFELSYYNYLTEDIAIIGDAEQLKRVINNIISNSVKYNDKRRGILNIRIRDAGDFIQVEIEDNGRGIARKDLPYIFDRFYRADASRNSATGGSGIGLSIVKKIIEDHGGRIWATSKEGTGTIIHFVLRRYQEGPQ